jgi:FKBP-type peptidyl-prolyl cis-trans isomerase
MVKGDKWEVVIPYHLAYGEKGNSSIPGYSTLAFEIEVMNVVGVNGDWE